MLQLEAFRKEDCFGSHRALTMASMMPAHQWWGANVCEQEAGELRLEALKVNCVATYHMIAWLKLVQSVTTSMEP